MQLKTLQPRIPVLLTLLIVGCESSDERLAQFAENSVQQQARQNGQNAAQSQQVAEASRLLVESETQARQAFSEQSRQLQAERIQVGQQRDALEVERKAIAGERQRDPIVAQAIVNASLIAACLLPLLLCYFVLKVVTSPGQEEIALSELLVEELVSEHSQLLLPPPAARRLEHAQVPPDAGTPAA